MSAPELECVGWWHYNTNAGRVHDHPDRPPRGGWSTASHRMCEPVFVRRPSTHTTPPDRWGAVAASVLSEVMAQLEEPSDTTIEVAEQLGVDLEQVEELCGVLAGVVQQRADDWVEARQLEAMPPFEPAIVSPEYPR